jgi:acyl carrier protein
VSGIHGQHVILNGKTNRQGIIMKTAEFIAKFEEDVVYVPQGSLTLETPLNDLEEWDSMATVAVLALVDEYLGLRLNGEQLQSCNTLGDLITLVNGSLEE